VKYDFGSYWTFKGALQWIPGFMKPSVNRLNDELDGLRWYTDSIIAPGIESSFESFGWFGMPFYALAFFVLAWEIPLFIVTHRISAMLKLAAFILIGCCMFFVRGSFVVWIGYSISYVGIIAISWPMWCMWVKPLNAVKRRAT
jgi:hypothetical protein